MAKDEGTELKPISSTTQLGPKRAQELGIGSDLPFSDREYDAASDTQTSDVARVLDRECNRQRTPREPFGLENRSHFAQDPVFAFRGPNHVFEAIWFFHAPRCEFSRFSRFSRSRV